MINFAHFTKKYTRVVLAFVVLVMVVPLILWGYMGGDPEDKSGEAGGVIFGSVTVPQHVYFQHYRRALPAYWWSQYNNRQVMVMWQYYGQAPANPTEDQLSKLAWERIALLHDAEEKGVTASEEEREAHLRKVWQYLARGQPFSDKLFSQVSEGFLHSRKDVVEGWIADSAVIEKLLDLVTNGEFADYNQVYDEVFKGERQAKAWVAAFDPRNYLRDVKPVRHDEVAKYYEKNKERFRVPEKVQVSYLLLEFEELKKKVAEPTEDEIKKYYTDNPVEFQKPHEHKPGEEHREGEKTETKTLDDVRAEIANKLKLNKAKDEARRVMARVNKDVGASYDASTKKFPDAVFDAVKDKYKAEGVALTHDVTTPFDARSVEDIEKAVGTGGTLSAWAFEKDRAAGDIIARPDETVKGLVLYRVQKKTASYVPDLTEPVRERITKALQKEQVRRRTQQAANTVVTEITANGFAAARRKFAAEWRPTRYFRNAGETGLEDNQLAGQVAQQIAGQMAVGTARALSGSMMMAREKADWSYVLYLEDAVSVPPEDAELAFRTSRERVERDARTKYRDDYVKELMTFADVKEDASLKRGTKSGKEPAPPPQP